MEWTGLLTYVLPAILTGAGGWFIGKEAKRKQKNDILQEMQNSIDKLVIENSRLLHEIVEVKTQNADLLVKVAKLTTENKQLRIEMAELNIRLENVKTITRTK